MTDYQRVSLTAKQGQTVTLQVQEINSDMDVLSRLTEDGVILEDCAQDMRKFVAMILCEYNYRDNAITADAAEQGWGFDDADQIVEDVELLSLQELPLDEDEDLDELVDRYEATLLVTLVHQAHADALELGTWGTAADPDGDLDDYFG